MGYWNPVNTRPYYDYAKESWVKDRSKYVPTKKRRNPSVNRITVHSADRTWFGTENDCAERTFRLVKRDDGDPLEIMPMADALGFYMAFSVEGNPFNPVGLAPDAVWPAEFDLLSLKLNDEEQLTTANGPNVAYPDFTSAAAVNTQMESTNNKLAIAWHSSAVITVREGIHNEYETIDGDDAQTALNFVNATFQLPSNTILLFIRMDINETFYDPLKIEFKVQKTLTLSDGSEESHTASICPTFEVVRNGPPESRHRLISFVNLLADDTEDLHDPASRLESGLPSSWNNGTAPTATAGGNMDPQSDSFLLQTVRDLTPNDWVSTSTLDSFGDNVFALVQDPLIHTTAAATPFTDDSGRGTWAVQLRVVKTDNFGENIVSASVVSIGGFGTAFQVQTIPIDSTDFFSFFVIGLWPAGVTEVTGNLVLEFTYATHIGRHHRNHSINVMRDLPDTVPPDTVRTATRGENGKINALMAPATVDDGLPLIVGPVNASVRAGATSGVPIPPSVGQITLNRSITTYGTNVQTLRLFSANDGSSTNTLLVPFVKSNGVAQVVIGPSTLSGGPSSTQLYSWQVEIPGSGGLVQGGGSFVQNRTNPIIIDIAAADTNDRIPEDQLVYIELGIGTLSRGNVNDDRFVDIRDITGTLPVGYRQRRLLQSQEQWQVFDDGDTDGIPVSRHEIELVKPIKNDYGRSSAISFAATIDLSFDGTNFVTYENPRTQTMLLAVERNGWDFGKNKIVFWTKTADVPNVRDIKFSSEG